MFRPSEAVLLESRSMRDTMSERIEALDKVKILRLLPDGVHVTAELVAGYFEVEYEAVRKIVKRHRAELESNGLVVLRGAELRRFKQECGYPQAAEAGDNPSVAGESYPQGVCEGAPELGVSSQEARDKLSLAYQEDIPKRQAHLTLLPRRAVLNVAMLLRDSDVARQVRGYLLDAEDASRSVDSGALAGVERRLDRLTDIVCAMSGKLVDLDVAVQDVRAGQRRCDERWARIARALRC